MKTFDSGSSPIIVALDFSSESAMWQFVERISPNDCRLKVGKELFTRFGPQLVESLRVKGFEIFLDLKFHDIPNTVTKACEAAADLGVWMVNVHASGGPKMIESVATAFAHRTNCPLLTAVTVLTSFDTEQYQAVYGAGEIQQKVLQLASMAQRSGVDGVVCSTHESKLIKQQLGESFLTVTPGIRMARDAVDDQSRIATPHQAIAEGADYLVMGRPITQAPNPSEALATVLQSITPDDC